MASDDLFARVSAVLREHYVNVSSPEQTADGGLPCSCGAWWEGSDDDEHDWDAHLADAVLDIVQPELDRLNTELARHASCAVCGHERHRHGYEPIIRQDWCSDCPTTGDLHTFKEASRVR